MSTEKIIKVVRSLLLEPSHAATELNRISFSSEQVQGLPSIPLGLLSPSQLLDLLLRLLLGLLNSSLLGPPLPLGLPRLSLLLLGLPRLPLLLLGLPRFLLCLPNNPSLDLPRLPLFLPRLLLSSPNPSFGLPLLPLLLLGGLHHRLPLLGLPRLPLATTITTTTRRSPLPGSPSS